MQPYNIRMTGGDQIRILADSCAQALHQALRKFPGQKISRCYSGGFPSNPTTGQGGIIEFEIPEHEPFTLNEPAFKAMIHTAAELFNLAQINLILAESSRAKAKDEHSTLAGATADPP